MGGKLKGNMGKDMATRLHTTLLMVMILLTQRGKVMIFLQWRWRGGWDPVQKWSSWSQMCGQVIYFSRRAGKVQMVRFSGQNVEILFCLLLFSWSNMKQDYQLGLGWGALWRKCEDLGNKTQRRAVRFVQDEIVRLLGNHQAPN